jgi:hypothetical protein
MAMPAAMPAVAVQQHPITDYFSADDIPKFNADYFNIMKRMNRIDIRKDAFHATTTVDDRGKDLFYAALNEIAPRIGNDAGLDNEIRQIKADALEFAMINWGCRSENISFLVHASAADLQERPAAPRNFGAENPLPQIEVGFHDSGYGPSTVREMSPELNPIREILSPGSYFDEGPRAKRFRSNRTVNPNVTINGNYDLGPDIIALLGLENCISRIASWYDPNGAGDGTGIMTLRIELRDGTVRQFTRNDWFSNTHVTNGTVGDTPDTTIVFDGNRLKNTWINEHGHAISQANIEEAFWYLVCKLIGDGLQVLYARLIIGPTAGNIITHAVFAGDEIVMARCCALKMSMVLQCHSRKEYADVGKITFYSPITDPLQFAIQTLRREYNTTIHDNNCIIQEIARVLGISIQQFRFILGPKAVDLNVSASIAVQGTPAGLNVGRRYEMNTGAIGYLRSVIISTAAVNMLLNANYDQAEQSRDISTIQNATALVKLGRSKRILDWFVDRSDNNVARMLPTRNLFSADRDGFQLKNWNGEIAAISNGQECECITPIIKRILRELRIDHTNRLLRDPLIAMMNDSRCGFDVVLYTTRYAMGGVRTNAIKHVEQFCIVAMQEEAVRAAANRAAGRAARASSRSGPIVADDLPVRTKRRYSEMDASGSASGASGSASGGSTSSRGGGFLDKNYETPPSIEFYEKIERIVSALVESVGNINNLEFRDKQRHTVDQYGLNQDTFHQFIDSCGYTVVELAHNTVLTDNFVEIVSLGFYTEYVGYFKRIGYTCLDDDILQYFLCQYIKQRDYNIMEFTVEFFCREMAYNSLKEDISEYKLVRSLNSIFRKNMKLLAIVQKNIKRLNPRYVNRASSARKSMGGPMASSARKSMGGPMASSLTFGRPMASSLTFGRPPTVNIPQAAQAAAQVAIQARSPTVTTPTMLKKRKKGRKGKQATRRYLNFSVVGKSGTHKNKIKVKLTGKTYNRNIFRRDPQVYSGFAGTRKHPRRNKTKKRR